MSVDHEIPQPGTLKRVLIVSPNWPPVSYPDVHRVRMSLPYFKEFGWEATILAVRIEALEQPSADTLLERTIPSDLEVVRVGALPFTITRRVGLGNVALRSLPFLWRAGNRLLNSGKFDLVYFSTTHFPTMILGPIWKRQFGVPYVIDLQDPWLHYYYMQTGTPPPGGKTKHGLARRVAHLLEPRVMRNVSNIICVSPAYPNMLMHEYPHLRPDQFEVLPMGGAISDFETLSRLPLKQTFFDANDGSLHWVYVGAAGLMMRPALRLLFMALQRARNAEEWKQLRLHFIGTSYAPKGRGIKTVEPLAAEFGLSDIIDERTDRVGYFEALRILADSHAILVIGSDSPSYSPSKLYPYMLTGKPMLSIMHEESPAIPILRACHAGLVVPFKPGRINDQVIDELIRALELLRNQSLTKSVSEMNWQAFEPYTARAMTLRQCAVFDRAMAA